MRPRLPGSLAGRLVAVASVLIAAAILVACLAMGWALQRFVISQIDQRLDAQAFAIVSALRPKPGREAGAGPDAGPDAALELAADFDAPPFDRPGSGWYWRVEETASWQGETLASSRSLGPRDELSVVSRPKGRGASRHGREGREGPDAPQPVEVEGRDGKFLHGREVIRQIAGREIRVLVTAPQQAIDGPLREALLPIVAAMLALAAALLFAIRLQVRLGLKPLGRLGEALADVRAGKARHVPTDQPREIAPLARELNTLIDENVEGLSRARRHVANLAHGLKTPLADLALTLRGTDGEDAQRLVEAMDRRIRHHLARARAAASGEASRAATPLKPHLEDLVAVLARIHAARDLSIEIDVEGDPVLACEAQDLDEMLGNLLDNACKWARGRVVVATREDGRMLRIAIEDDGAGIDAARLPEALQPGRRLDEMTPGHGFGLSITRELAELYGGGIQVGRSDLGGLAAHLELPRRQA